MTALTLAQKRQRRDHRRTIGSTADRRQFRIIVLPGPIGGAFIQPAEPEQPSLRATLDDLDQATWEDAEWR